MPKALLFHVILRLYIFLLALTDAALMEISKQLPILEELDVSHCVKVTDEGIISCARNLRRLRALSLSNCDLVTDNALCAVMTYCPRYDIHMYPNIIVFYYFFD